MPSPLQKVEWPLQGSSTDDANAEMATLGQRLRKLRLAKGFGVRTLARRINVSPSLISHIELGKGAPSVKTLYALVAAFGVPLSDIFVKGKSAEDEVQREPLHLVQERVAATRDSHPPQAEHPADGRGAVGPVLKASERRAIQLEHGFRWECLTPGTDYDVEFMETIIAVGGGRPDSEMKTHSGTEYGIVLKGKLGVKIAFDSYVLEPRDSIRFDSTLPHCMWNAGDEPVHSIWFVRGRSS